MSSSTCSMHAEMPPRSARRVLGGSLASLTSFECCCCCLLLEREVADVDAFARFVAVDAEEVGGPAIALPVMDCVVLAFGSEARVFRFNEEAAGEAGRSGGATVAAASFEPSRAAAVSCTVLSVVAAAT